MARRIRKKTSPPPAAQADNAKPSKLPASLLIAILVTAILAGIPFGLGKYIEFNSPGPFDSGAYVYSAKHLLDGAKMGVDELPTARPGTLIANIVGVKLFGFNDTGPKIVQMLLQLAALIFLFWTMRNVFGLPAAVISTTLAALYLSAPLIAKFGNVKEQFMIPFMIAAACAACRYAVTQKKVWLIVAGFFALQPYYFKPTGLSVVLAIVLYILIANMLAKQWKTAWTELVWFLAGFTLGMTVPAGLYLWQGQLPGLLKTLPALAIALGIGALIVSAVPYLIDQMAEKKNIEAVKKIPHGTWAAGIIAVILLIAVTQWGHILSAAGLKGENYLGGSHSAKSIAEVAPQVFRYYKALMVPITAALIAVITAAVVTFRKNPQKDKPVQTRLAWMLAAWWGLDMAFIWISPRSYEQYYLPLCASAAVLSGFTAWLWLRKAKAAAVKVPWLIGGLAAVFVLALMTIPIFTGQRYSPDTGADYVKQVGYKRRGFAEALKRVKTQTVAPWQIAGDYIRAHSDKSDTLYVWGWVPGIYVRAQRLAPVPKAFESDMHVIPPQILALQVDGIVRRLEQNPPKFIVDSRKIHFPNDRPPLELWPHTYSRENRFGVPIPNDPAGVAQYDTLYKKLLAEQFDPNQKQYAQLPGLTSWLQMAPWTQAMPDEAQRYDAMKPLRNFVMTRYKIVSRPEFATHVVFERID